MGMISSGSNGEFRVFKQLEAINDEEYITNFLDPWKKLESYVEERMDLYVFPLTLDKKVSHCFGLKFRHCIFNTTQEGDMVLNSSLLELKVRGKVSKEKVENWNKIVAATLFPKINLMTSKISQDKINECITLDNGVTFQINLKEIKEQINNCLNKKSFTDKKLYLDAFQNYPLGFALTYKARVSIGLETAFIKLTTFKIEEESKEIKKSNVFYLQSLCVEGYVSNEDTKIKDQLPECFIAGYPEAILKFI